MTQSIQTCSKLTTNDSSLMRSSYTNVITTNPRPTAVYTTKDDAGTRNMINTAKMVKQYAQCTLKYTMISSSVKLKQVHIHTNMSAVMTTEINSSKDTNYTKVQVKQVQVKPTREDEPNNTSSRQYECRHTHIYIHVCMYTNDQNFNQTWPKDMTSQQTNASDSSNMSSYNKDQVHSEKYSII